MENYAVLGLEPPFVPQMLRPRRPRGYPPYQYNPLAFKISGLFTKYEGGKLRAKNNP